MSFNFSLSSINSRIIIGAIIVVSCFMSLTGLTLNKTFYNSAYSALEERLTAQIYLLMAERKLTPIALASKQNTLSVDVLHSTYSSLSGFITQSDGKVLWQSTTSNPKLIPPTQTLAHGKKIFQTFQVDTIEYIGLSIAICWDISNCKFPLIYHITDDLTDLNQVVASYRKDLWFNLVLMSVIFLATLVIILRWGLKPLRDVEDEIKSVEQGRQDQIRKNYPDEIQPLTENINQLIRYERKQQERYQNALADLAHSLKTPLAILNGQPFDTENPEQYLKTVETNVSRMNDIVQYQLQRASTANPSPHIQLLKLGPVIQSILNSMEKIYQEKQINFQTQVQDDLEYKIDEGDLMEILGNLMDNACKWCNSQINLLVKGDSKKLIINVEDDGPGIDNETMKQITSRGYRADQLTPGHGVGLAIVKDIVQAHNGNIQFSHANIGGLSVHIDFQL
jgi:two-component system sensor histidine kinase PhoQ